MSKQKIIVDYITETIALTKHISGSFIELGRRLHKIYTEELFKGKYDRWEDFLEEIKFTPSSASKLIGIYEVFVLRDKIAEPKLIEAGVGALGDGLKLCRENPQKSLEYVELGRTLSSQDLRRELKRMQGGKSEEECVHQFYEVHLRQCKICGAREGLESL